MQQRQFEFANKPGKYLVGLLKRRGEKLITTLRKEGEERIETSDNKETRRIFEVFFSKLYQKNEVDHNRMR